MTEERKQSLFLDYIDGTLDAEGMEELHALTEADPSAKEELFSLKEMADMASQDDGMSSFEKDRRAAGLIRAVTGGPSSASGSVKSSAMQPWRPWRPE